MKIDCMCGKQSQLDVKFVYAVQCPYCKRVYECEPTVKLNLVESTEYIPTVAEK